ncbi:MAG: bile acid:sodium symporter family protein [Sedimentisphaerales bacterium]|nr:bile acid:sodium symporter family protein [Sedimentisphaerales bacterium]
MAKKAMPLVYQVCLVLSGACLLGLIACSLGGFLSACRALAVACPILLAVGLTSVPSLKGYRYTVCVVAAVVAAMVYPEPFRVIGGAGLSKEARKRLTLIVIQVVMFGMGTQMSVRDFLGVVKMPKAVIIGIACQFTIMPLVGFALAKTLGFPPEIGAGIILIGSCSSGLASNVMVYLAGANLALSVTLTSLATLMAPVMTPLWMKLLASEMVPVDFWEMMMDIVLMVVLPILAALIYNWIRRDRLKALQCLMPLLSMAGIIYFTAITTAAGRDYLLEIGALLFVAAILHNSVGYVLGYWAAWLFGLDRDSCRTIAIEVGLQNGGMASGLAARMGRLATVGLAPAIFSPWMNVSGSVLANYWRKHQTGRATAANNGRVGSQPTRGSAIEKGSVA